MNKYSKIYNFLFFLFSIVNFFPVCGYESEVLDIMVDFAYPISAVESVRHDLSQSIFYVQQNQVILAISLLDQARVALESCSVMYEDDRQFFKNMLERMNACVDQLEDEDKAMILTLTGYIQNQL